MTTLVCIPWRGAGELLNRAAASVLSQTIRDIALIVIGDGEDPIKSGWLHPSTYLDDRCVVYTLPENRGPYFAQQVALTASPFPRYAVVGADDWVEPDHLERLQAVGGSAVITGAVWFHDRKGKVRVHEAGYEVGLFDTDRLLELGGHNPAERMGQDTLMVRLLRLTGDLRATHHPTYHRVKRDGSLMSSPRTGPGSKARNEMRYRNRLVYAAAQRLRSVDAIREHRLSLVPEDIADEVAEHAARLGSRLGQEVVAA